MSYFDLGKQVLRKSFGKLKDIVPVPNLIEVQSKSFNEFVQLDCLPHERLEIGLEKVLKDIFPIEYEDKMSLEYVSYELGDWACTCSKLTGITNRYSWSCSSCKKSDCSRLASDLSCTFCHKKTAKYKTCANCLSRVTIKTPMTSDECRVSGQTFSMPLRIRIQLTSWDVATGDKKIRDIKEQDIFFSDLPVMIDIYKDQERIRLGNQGTFLINGVDRVVVSQMHRSPGAVFSKSKKIKDARGKTCYLARIIPMRGSWLDFEFDSNDLLYVRIDKKKKLLVTTFLQAFGIPRDSIIPMFYQFENVTFENGKFSRNVDDLLIGQRLETDMLPESLADLNGRRVNKEILAKLLKISDKLELPKSYLINKILAKDLIDPKTGEIIVEQGQALDQDSLELLKKYKKLDFDLVSSSGYVYQPTLAATLVNDVCYSQEEALKEVHAKVWPGETITLKDIQARLENLFFSRRLYDLTEVGRIRMNRKLGLDIAPNVTTLTKDDLVATVRYLVNLREKGEGELDDIDHLGNRRVRLVGELLSNQIYLGLSRIERIVRERFRLQEISGTLMPQDLLNVKPLGAVIREFFGTGQLSQFMDQTNPLAEIAHKRRLSALGPGGVLKDRATYEIRDVHTSHYGRICPIETPEGQTIGLISSLATYAMVNTLGFIETAYRSVKNGKITDEVVFLDAFEEAGKYIAQAEAGDEKTKSFKSESVLARHEGNFLYTNEENIDYIDLSPKQLVSVAAALIPFLEHDDATRALMGANMQRQAVPLIKSQAPVVASGMESEVCRASGAVVSAKNSGVVEYVSGDTIIVRADESEFPLFEDWLANGVDIYHLRKFKRSSYSTWIHQRPVVVKGQRVKAGESLTDGPAINKNELALGSNLLVAYMPWNGYNFEDAIVLNKRLVSDDVFTSVHIDEYIVDARETKLGPEEITADIPNVSETALAALDEEGIVRIGTRVRAGDILVGKVTLKGDVQYSPEEKLLRAIFGEKAREVRDTSLRVPPGIEGTVVDVKVFSRSGIRKDKRYKEIVTEQTNKIENEYSYHLRLLKVMVTEKLINLFVEKKGSKVIGSSNKKTTLNHDQLKELAFEELINLKFDELNDNIELNRIKSTYDIQIKVLESLKEERINKLKKGDVLPSGVIKMVKVYVASKRTVSVGDKMAGRHGNKGVVSVLVPREDMPYMEDGTPVDIVLNPLGVPSRMNVGQILETILGFAGQRLGKDLGKILQEHSYEEVKKFLVKYFSKDFIENYEKNNSKEEIMELARRMSENGVHFKSPVFDGASFEDDIKPILDELGMPYSGAFKLKDGRTDQYFDQNVTVGCVYMMKLNHMVDDKLHARSVGPYSLVTQQPLGGKAQFGGQRFGEMEVWALEAYGAAYTLQELLTYKSDDVTGRHKVYEAIVRGDGDNIPEPGLPESFNVMIKELQSLALQIDLFKTSKEEVGD
ncbi:MAG: DNA-directed RNA polymerase subunit beta [Candidatus Babeliales bacterium]|nr:DNA-directed RNA polymerase subunit beta [Candidatus Babeliales bacterium]